MDEGGTLLQPAHHSLALSPLLLLLLLLQPLLPMLLPPLALLLLISPCEMLA